MEEIHEEIKEAIKQLEACKNRYRTMDTQDVIDMIKRLNENVKLTIPDVIVSLPTYGKCDCREPLKCVKICHDLIKRSGNAL